MLCSKPMDKESREAQREAVKTLAIAIGVREAARQLGLNEDRVRQWSKRYHWLKHESKPQPPTVTKNDVTVVTKPSVALANILADDTKATKIGFSKAARKVAEAQAELPVETLRMPKEALTAKSWVDVAGKAQGWDSEDYRTSPLNLNLLSQNTVIAIGPADKVNMPPTSSSVPSITTD